MATNPPVSIYEFRSTFRAPLPFVYAWCTDYSPEDPDLEKDTYVRKILHQNSRRTVYEDLYDTRDGWMWSRQVVTFHPPNRWHAEATGNHRDWSIDYELATLPGGRTELRFRGERRQNPLGEKNPPKASMERELRAAWKHFAHALERDYRASRNRATRRRP